MFHSNVPAIFETEMHSKYKVDRYGLTRDKVADPTRKTERQEKNIYYVDEKDGDKILELLSWDGKSADRWVLNRVVSIMEDTHHMVLKNSGSGKEAAFEMSRIPQKGQSPFDFFCNQNGQVPDNNRNHVGHKIINLERSEY